MLDNDNGTTPAETTPQPPRRRAASRAAGPPPEVAAPFSVPQTAAAQPTPSSAPADEADSPPATPTRSRRATRPAAAADADVPVVADDKPTVTAKRAPAKSRAKTAPTEASESLDLASPQETPASDTVSEKPKRTRRTPAASTTDADPATEAATEKPAAEEKPATRRRRASRPAASPEPEAVTSPVAEAAPTSEAAPASDEPASQEKPTTRRRRATRPTAPAEADTSDTRRDVAEALDALTAQVESSKDQATSPDSSSEPVADKPARRRRATRPTASPEPAAEESTEADEVPEMDGITAALKIAESEARSRRALVADPFTVTAENRQAHLDKLAQSIASDEDDEDDEDEDEDSDDSSDDHDSDDDSDDDSSSDDDSDDDSDDSDDASQDSDGERGNRRRRRRGGRRRRRGGSGNRGDSDDSAQDSDDSGDAEDPGETQGTAQTADDSGSNDAGSDDSDDDEASTDDDSDNGSGNGTTRRRRRRRRSGGDSKDSSKSTGEDAITGIEGSTRMEAKRQRRRENRAAGRRRAPILSEAEFLARRESVDRKLIIRQGEEYTQLAVVEDDILVEHYVDRASAMSLIGNVYLGKVQNVLPSMEAAFIDIGRGRNAVLYAGEVDWSGFDVSSENRKVEKVFKSGQTVLVQVTKDPVGAKGARLTGHISLPGRYVVYSPGGHLSGISRKLPDSERARLREILGDVIGDEESVIVRTAAEGASAEELVRDVNRLKAQWEVIEKKSAKGGGAPASLYTEPDLTLRIVRDLFTEDFGALVVQGNDGPDDSFEEISAYVAHVAPSLADRVQHYRPDEKGHDAFTEYRIDEQIAKALDRKVHLPSGGSLVIDRTEAMTVIDVNTGRFTGSGGNLEATVTSNNLEAAEEVVRQLRLRDIGGIIVVDFIDMVLPSNRDLLLRRLVECLGRDRTRHQVAEVTSLGLVQLTRKKIGTGLAEAFTEVCEHCHGDGYLRSLEPVDSQAPSDGGDRRSHGGNGSGGGKGRSGRGRRGGNGQQGGGNGSEKKSD